MGCLHKRIRGLGRWLPTLVAAGLPACDHGLDEGPSGTTGIAGTISFSGEWSGEIGQVAVAVYEKLPEEASDLLALSGADQDVVLGSAAYEYFVPLEGDGVYRWIIVAWRRPDAFWNFTSLLGCYQAPNDSLPGSVDVLLGEIREGIDIEVDLALVANPPVPGSTPCTRVLPLDILELAAGG